MLFPLSLALPTRASRLLPSSRASLHRLARFAPPGIVGGLKGRQPRDIFLAIATEIEKALLAAVEERKKVEQK